MSTETVVDLWQVLTVVSTVPAVLTVIVYGRVPWWRDDTGRQLMANAVVVAAVLVVSSISIWYSNNTWFPVLGLAVFAPFPVVVTWQLWLHVRAQVRDARDHDYDPPES